MTNLERVGLVTTTQYPGWGEQIPSMANVDKVRGDLALDMLEMGEAFGVKILVVDSEQSSAEFRKELIKRGVPHKDRVIRSLSGQRREAILAMRMQDVDVIFLNDPEKISVVKDGLIACADAILNGGSDIVIPERDAQFFERTYPQPQVLYERKQNLYINRALRRHGIMRPEHPDFDWLIGVRFMRNIPEVTGLFLDEYRYNEVIMRNPELARLLNPELWPNGQYIPVIAALKKGLRVASVKIPYVHPKSQTDFENQNEAEFTAKRKTQLRNIVVGCIQGMHYLNGNPKTILKKVE